MVCVFLVVHSFAQIKYQGKLCNIVLWWKKYWHGHWLDDICCLIKPCKSRLFPTCNFKKFKYAAMSAQNCSFLKIFHSVLFLRSQPLLPSGCVLPRRVSTVTNWIWSTVNVSSHSSWIINTTLLLLSLTFLELQITTWIFRWLVLKTCLCNHYFIRTNECMLIDELGETGSWFITKSRW